MQLRRATMEDMYEMQHNNLRCLPENYNLSFFYYHLLSWPQLLYVQQDYNRNTVGYVLGKMDDEEVADKKHGHITSLAVLRSHRKLGIASRVMRATMKEMDTEYGANFCSLHVRKTNDAALHLYQDTLGFRCAGVEEKYYVDEEDAYHMKKFFHKPNPGTYVDDSKHLIHKPLPGEEKHVDAASSGGAAAAAAVAAGSSGAARGGEKSGGGGKNKAGHAAESDATAKEREAAMAALLEMDGDGGRGGKGKGGAGNKGKGAPAGKKSGGKGK